MDKQTVEPRAKVVDLARHRARKAQRPEPPTTPPAAAALQAVAA